jgi:hypothetical protein
MECLVTDNPGYKQLPTRRQKKLWKPLKRILDVLAQHRSTMAQLHDKLHYDYDADGDCFIYK